MMLDFRKIIRDSANTKLSMLETCIDDIAVSYTHLTLPPNREV